MNTEQAQGPSRGLGPRGHAAMILFILSAVTIIAVFGRPAPTIAAVFLAVFLLALVYPEASRTAGQTLSDLARHTVHAWASSKPHQRLPKVGLLGIGVDRDDLDRNTEVIESGQRNGVKDQ